MYKVYAKTLNPEDFDYRIYDIREDDYNPVIIDGGRQFCNVDNNDYLKDIKKLISEYNDYYFEVYYHNSIMAFLQDMLPAKENGKKLSTFEAKEIKEVLDSNCTTDKDVICVCLKVVTGIKHEYRCLRGCCQGDVVWCYYPVTCSKAYIDFVEAWFFGTGTEIMIHEEDNEVTCADDISGYTFYTATWNVNELKEEIKHECGYKPEDEVEVVLYQYKSSYRVRHDEYELAE